MGYTHLEVDLRQRRTSWPTEQKLTCFHGSLNLRSEKTASRDGQDSLKQGGNGDLVTWKTERGQWYTTNVVHSGKSNLWGRGEGLLSEQRMMAHQVFLGAAS